MLQVLPSWYPIVTLAAVVALFEYGEGLAEVLDIDIVEDLPEYLAVFKLAPCGYSTGNLKSVDLVSAC